MKVWEHKTGSLLSGIVFQARTRYKAQTAGSCPKQLSSPTTCNISVYLLCMRQAVAYLSAKTIFKFPTLLLYLLALHRTLIK